jgi:hypothetical protein
LLFNPFGNLHPNHPSTFIHYQPTTLFHYPPSKLCNTVSLHDDDDDDETSSVFNMDTMKKSPLSKTSTPLNHLLVTPNSKKPYSPHPNPPTLRIRNPTISSTPNVSNTSQHRQPQQNFPKDPFKDCLSLKLRAPPTGIQKNHEKGSIDDHVTTSNKLDAETAPMKELKCFLMMDEKSRPRLPFDIEKVILNLSLSKFTGSPQNSSSSSSSPSPCSSHRRSSPVAHPKAISTLADRTRLKSLIRKIETLHAEQTVFDLQVLNSVPLRLHLSGWASDVGFDVDQY